MQKSSFWCKRIPKSWTIGRRSSSNAPQFIIFDEKFIILNETFIIFKWEIHRFWWEIHHFKQNIGHCLNEQSIKFLIQIAPSTRSISVEQYLRWQIIGHLEKNKSSFFRGNSPLSLHFQSFFFTRNNRIYIAIRSTRQFCDGSAAALSSPVVNIPKISAQNLSTKSQHKLRKKKSAGEKQDWQFPTISAFQYANVEIKSLDKGILS